MAGCTRNEQLTSHVSTMHLPNSLLFLSFYVQCLNGLAW